MTKDERIALVDKDDNVIGYKMRSELTDNDCWRIVCVWIENSRGEVLLQQRALGLSLNPGLWSNAVVGTVDEDDNYKETAVREAEEEIGLTGFPLIETNKIYYKASFGWRIAQGFTVKCDWELEKFTAQPEEVMKLEWVERTRLLEEITGKHPLSKSYTNAYTHWTKLFELV